MSLLQHQKEEDPNPQSHQPNPNKPIYKFYRVESSHTNFPNEVGMIVAPHLYIADPTLIILEFKNNIREVFRSSEVSPLKRATLNDITSPKLSWKTPGNSASGAYLYFPCIHCGAVTTIEKRNAYEKKTKLCRKHSASKKLRKKYAFKEGETLLKWLKNEHPEMLNK